MHNEFEQRTRTSAISRWNLQKSVSIVYLYFEIYFHFKVCMNQIRSLSKGRVSKIQQVRVVKIYRACCQRIVLYGPSTTTVVFGANTRIKFQEVHVLGKIIMI